MGNVVNYGFHKELPERCKRPHDVHHRSARKITTISIATTGEIHQPEGRRLSSSISLGMSFLMAALRGGVAGRDNPAPWLYFTGSKAIRSNLPFPMRRLAPMPTNWPPHMTAF